LKQPVLRTSIVGINITALWFILVAN